ncbi:MAG TPA: ThuA domain-containing protein [Pirellulales bacterium]|nr:ThuA domain-containing protein [Pirellulales bacterium]
MKYAVVVRTAVLVLCGAITVGRARADEPRLPPAVVLEQQPGDAQATKIVFVAGSNYFKPGQHEYIGGCAALMDLARQTRGVFPVLALDWPKDPQTFAGAKTVVFFFDGGEKHPLRDPAKRAEVQKLADAGVGLVGFHQFVDVPKELGDTMRGMMGAAFEKDYSRRAHWIAEFKSFPSHEICRGVERFEIDDGWLYRLRFVAGMQGIAPLVHAPSPKPNSGQASETDTIVSWAFERPQGGRSFTFTGAHLHASLAQEGYRRLLTNGILWTAGLEIPETGAPVELAPGRLDSYLSPPATPES